MPKQDNIHKILIIGSGPGRIGQAGTDFSPQVCTQLRDLGYTVVVVNSNPASVITDPALADATYIEPLTIKVITEIIVSEKPDAIIPSLGGRTSLNLCLELAESGILDQHGVRLLGLGPEAIRQTRDRSVFREAMAQAGLEMPRSIEAASADESETAAATLGLPLILRPAGIRKKTGPFMAYNMEEVRDMAEEAILDSPAGRVLAEESVLDWDELEVEAIRDNSGQSAVICLMEHVDSAGIHAADSVCVFPPQTVSGELRNRIAEKTRRIADRLNITGCINIRFAHNPDTDRLVVLSAAPRFSRSSALAMRMTGFPVDMAVALIACGMNLDELPFGLPDEPPANRVVVKFPRWAFEKFPEAEDRLDTRPRSVGDVMAVGMTYKEALQKAVRSLDINHYGLGFARDFHRKSLGELILLLGTPSSERQFLLYEALRKGADVEQLARKTRIQPWFIRELKELTETENELLVHRENMPPDALLARAAQDGFSDRYLSDILCISEAEIREKRKSLGITGAWKPLAERTDNICYFGTFQESGVAVQGGTRKKMMILGSGPNRIGQSGQFDACCVQAIRACRDAGYETVMVNCNPGAITTGSGMADRVYIAPVTVEDVLAIAAFEQPDGILTSFGGPTALETGAALEAAGFTVPGTPAISVAISRSREKFRDMLRKTGIPQPRSAVARTSAEALEAAGTTGYPLMVRPSGKPVEIMPDADTFRHYLATIADVSPERPVRLDQFMENAIEAEVDAVADGTDAVVPVVLEHVELAGVHSGDSAAAIPPVGISPKHMETIRDYTRRIAVELGVVGLMSIRFAIADNTVYVLEANLRASRTVPLISGICNIPLCAHAVAVMLGQKISEIPDLKPVNLPFYGVREAVFPFQAFPGTDPLLGPEMRSIGEVLGLADSFGRAFFKSQEAAGGPLPLEGTVLMTVADRDKPAILESAGIFRYLGFRIVATRGTCRFLSENGIVAEPVKKLGYGRPDILDAIKNGGIHLVINTTDSRQSQIDDAYIRKATARYGVPDITTTAAAAAAARGISARRQGKPKVRSLQHYHADI